MKAIRFAAFALLFASFAMPGERDFDFEFGDWAVHHRVKRTGGEWQEFEGTATARPILGGLGNVEDCVFHRPEGVSRGVAMRSYDPATGQWAIWWVDGRAPHGALDPPVKGRFEKGIGTFYSDSELNGKPVRTRFTWSQITPTSARWEQAFSYDAGKTWDTNWVMEFRRPPRATAGGGAGKRENFGFRRFQPPL